MNAGFLLVAAPATPLVLLLAGLLVPPLRRHLPDFLAQAPVPALVAAFLAMGNASVDGETLLLGMALRLDFPGAVLLGFCALLWITCGAFASTYIRGSADRERFSVFWLLTLSGNLGVFIAADIISFYLAFGLVSLPAYGLVVHDGTDRSRRAGLFYLVLAVLGETCLLLGLMLMASGADSLLISDAVGAIPSLPYRDLTLGLLVAGFGLKAGLFPLHVWLPMAHPAAPTPASAVLSGAIIKAGIIGLIKFLPLGTGLPEWSLVLTTAGLFTAYFGVLMGVTQSHPKAVLAYSSLSQMGLVITLLASGLVAAGVSAGDVGADHGADGIAQVAAFYAVHHGLAKGALFLAVGVVGATGAARIGPVLAVTAVIALGVAGLPLTGGALAKLELKGPLGGGLVETLVAWSAVGTALLMLHFLRRLRMAASADAAARPSPGLSLPWGATVLAAALVPWGLYAAAGSHDLAYAVKPGNLWALTWPILLAGILGWSLRRIRLPSVPEGDIVEPIARLLEPVRSVRLPPLPGVPSIVEAVGRAAAGIVVAAEAPVRPFPAAGLALLAVAAIMAFALAG